jgi:hypothetical protein
MSIELNGRFDVAGWDEAEVHAADGAAKLTVAHIRYAFSGGIEGSALCEAVMAYRRDGGAEYAGLLRIDGTIAGRSGTFVIRETGVFEEGVARSEWTIVPLTGAGELEGITGTGSYYTEGHGGIYTLSVDLK